jgi:hypothetical protein
MKRFFRLFMLVAIVTVFMAVPAMARERIARNCKGCHSAGENTIWGLLRAGSQKEGSFEVVVDGTLWHVTYDKNSRLKKLQSIKQLRNEEAVMVRYRNAGAGNVYALEVRYKPNLSFIPADAVMEIGDLVNLLKQDPDEANYILFDARGVGDYNEGHIPGAVSLPYYRFNHFKNRLPKDKNTLIVMYCNSYG